MNEIVTQVFLKLHKIIEQHKPKNDTLLSGRLGLSLYYDALHEASDKPVYAEKAAVMLEQVYANLAKDDFRLFGNSFGGGGAGLGYVVTQLYKSGLIEINLRDDLDALNEYLYKTSLEQIRLHDKIDYLHGATGIIHYFTQRLPDRKIEHYLINLVTTLCNKAVIEKEVYVNKSVEQGIWFKSWVINIKETAEINFSLSHGLSSFLILLSDLYKSGLQLACIKETVTRGIHFMLSFQQDIDVNKNKWSFFPSTVNATDRSQFFLNKRLGWCYGDFGPILLLYKAGATFDKPEWIEKANLLGTFTIMRKDPESTGTTESLFCHGSAGMAQFYQSFYTISGIEQYKEAQQYWIEQTISMIPSELEKGVYLGKECDLLEGLVGVNLCLLSFVSTKSLSWTKAFLLS